jgi:hypothetical protein
MAVMICHDYPLISSAPDGGFRIKIHTIISPEFQANQCTKFAS